MSDDQLTPQQLEWVKSVYRALGWAFKEQDEAERETAAAIKEKEEKEIAQATAKTKAEDDKKVEAAVTEATAERIKAESDEKLKDVTAQLSELKADVKDHFVHKNEDTDADALAALASQSKQLLERLNSIYGHKKDFENYPSEAIAFDKSYENAKALIQTAALEIKTKDTDGAHNSLIDAESTVDDMQTLWQGVVAAAKSKPAEPPVPAELKPYVMEVGQGIKSMTGIGFSGPATRLGKTLKDVRAAKVPKDDPAWEILLYENEMAMAAVGEFDQLKNHIQKLATSLRNSGVADAAGDIETTLDNYMSDASRTVPTIRSLLSSLKASAAHKNSMRKEARWDAAQLGERTERFRDDLKKLVLYDKQGNLVTKPDERRAIKRAGDVPGLKKDVMIQIPRRPDDAKEIPRKTVDSLLQTFDFLDELKASGVTGVEDIAVEEFLKAEAILSGIQKDPGAYKKLTKKLKTLREKIDEISKGMEGAYYIEERLRLTDDIDDLEEEALSMNIEKALASCTEMEAKQLHPLEEGVRKAIKNRELFDTKVETIKGQFTEIPKLLAQMGKADPSLAKMFGSLFAPDQIKQYHGDLDVFFDQAKDLAYNATTNDELAHSLDLANRLIFRVDRFVLELEGQLSHLHKLAEMEKKGEKIKDSDRFSKTELKYFKKLENDYKKGVARQKDQKEAKNAFLTKSGPLKVELDMMTSEDISINRILAYYKGVDRVDPSKFDTSRLKELRMEIAELEDQSDASHTHKENLAKLKELEGALDAMRGEITGFREDIARDISTFSEKCIARLIKAKQYIDSSFVNAVKDKQDAGEEAVDVAALRKFSSSISQPLALAELPKQVATIADKSKDLKERKKARENALRQVRPLIAQLDNSQAIQLYMRHPFSDLPNDLNILRPELIQLEVKLLSLGG
ncbi:hypothetical protein [Pseudovibrio sp. POLY-S9]|uniref:hypothetical protein n=1 Tax=Pseudovibrio sp. POLY-S9 TaxID=1576596 RepID=UPI000710D437|nr:hypothetical protein [Pseudovibrio sp. POLY-S9]